MNFIGRTNAAIESFVPRVSTWQVMAFIAVIFGLHVAMKSTPSAAFAATTHAVHHRCTLPTGSMAHRHTALVRHMMKAVAAVCLAES